MEYRSNGYLIIRDIILDMLLINALWLVTMIKSVISNNIILFLKKKGKKKKSLFFIDGIDFYLLSFGLLC